MVTIYIDSNLGIDINNMPVEIFKELVSLPERSLSGRLMIKTENKDLVINSLGLFLRHSGINYRIYPSSENLITINSVATTPVNPGLREPEARIQPQTPQEPDEFDDMVEALDEQHQEESFTPDNSSTSNRIVPAPVMAGLTPLNEAQSVEMITQCMENEQSSKSKNLSDKVNEFNKLWTKMLNRKRQLELLTAEVRSNPIIEKLIREVRELNENPDNLIDTIFFASNYIVFRTKELITDLEYSGHRRIIGRMECRIYLKPLVGSASECMTPIEIYNLDRVLRSSNNVWHCGHSRGGNDMCIGNIGLEQLFRALEMRDIPSIVEIIIRFIKNPNQNDSWGSHIKYWPEYHPDQNYNTAREF